MANLVPQITASCSSSLSPWVSVHTFEAILCGGVDLDIRVLSHRSPSLPWNCQVCLRQARGCAAVGVRCLTCIALESACR